MNHPSGRQKIVILGGGVGAMTTAYYLTEAPDWQEKYEITVYQLGWRLGGKGASGRGEYGRIEEHGLHMWYGFYENAFATIQGCYGALGRQRGEPLATWEEAFKPQSFTVYQEQIDGQWLHWPMILPVNNSTPGEGGEFPSVADYLVMMLEWMVDTLLEAQEPLGPPPPTNSAAAHSDVQHMPWWQSLLAEAEQKAAGSAYHFAVLTLMAASKLLSNPEAHHALLMGNSLDEVIELLKHVSQWLRQLFAAELRHNTNMRRLWIMIDLVGSTLRGLVADDVRSKGLASINDKDYAQWLIEHGADQEYTVPFVYHNLYDQAFAFEDGDCRRPNFAAGIVVYTAMRTYFTYKGAFLWKMQAGMGDTIFGPFYQVLKKRGVNFNFFRRVENLHIEGNAIGKVSIARQVDVKPEVEAQGGYDPFVNIKGLPCWPSEPRYEQLVQGEQLKADKINLESYWTPWRDVGHEELVAGQDYDVLVLGISLGALPYIARELVTASADWENMVQRVKTTQTQAFQLWFKPDDAGLGWPMWRQQPATLTGYDADDDPEQAGLDTWGDFSHLIIREDWPSDHFPNNIAYLCGAMKGVDGLKLPPRSDHAFPEREAERAKQNSLHFLKNYVRHLWPEATLSGTPQELNWDLLVDTQAQHGAARFDSQFWRANIDPSERYVLCVADSAQFRLSPGDSRFANLYLAGDWTNNGLLSLGCVESAVIGGMQAANAILPQFGYPVNEIIGWAPL